MLRTFTLTVENKPGVLLRVTGLLSSTGTNIERLTVSATSDPAVSRIELVADLEDHLVRRMVPRLERMIHVIEAQDVSEAGVAACQLLIA